MRYGTDLLSQVDILRRTKEATILAIESSCDDTSAAVVKNGRQELALRISSQIDTHVEYGGVVPEIASRMHTEAICSQISSVLKDASIEPAQIDAVAVTAGPGLVGSLLVGVSYAKAYAYVLNKPLIAVHHIEGHISANYLDHPELVPPYLCLVVSGGHTMMIEVLDYGRYRVLGTTRDDAAGEAFDKGARALGLPYPGGKYIDQLAADGSTDSFVFPNAYVRGSMYDFSFSGIKTSLVQMIHKNASRDSQWIELHLKDLAASYQSAIVRSLVEVASRAIEKTGYRTLAIAGGVAANRCLREELNASAAALGATIFMPTVIHCTDNASMIGAAAYYRLLNGNVSGLDLNAVPSLPIDGDFK